MGKLRRVVLDILKPHDPPLLVFSERIDTIECVDGVTASLIELDKEVENVKLTVEGEDIDYEAIEEAISGLGGTVHSVDQVAYGEYVVKEQRTLQDD
ncbi:DUF211 domain-containing protein [Haloarcula sp. GH36]|uniref:DUF211 domain-containing protein n=1 Tax=Haloarcula montana TaxID=3111776 RepID=UPI002D774758|nr:DUF211 domain-containing protein [Haloarcula sp. GH36]